MLKKIGVPLVMVALTALALSGCKVPEHLKLRCTAELDEAFAEGVDSGAPVDIHVKATGGEAPYYLLGKIGTFNPSTTISRIYTNASDEDVTTEDTVIVNDNLGFTAQCSVSVIVHPEPDDPEPSLDVAIAPSDSVAVDKTITLTAAVENLSDPVFDFAFDEQGIAVDVDDNEAIFSVTDDLAHSFEVVVSSSVGDISIEKTVALTFSLNTPEYLSCTLSHTAGDYEVDETIQFSVIASTGEPVSVVTGNTGAGGVVDYVNQHLVGIHYTTPGTKTVTIKARSLETGIECNDGAYLNDVVEISYAPLTCEAFTDKSNYRVWYGTNFPNYDGQLYNTVVTWAEIPDMTGVDSVEVVGVSVSDDADGHYYPYQNEPLAKEVSLYEDGYFRITLTVEDNNGRSANCETDYFRVWP